MNKKKLSKNGKTDQRMLQIVLGLLLIGIPIFMIIINGTDALKGITWIPKKHDNTIVSNSSQISNSHQKIIYGIYDPQKDFYTSESFDIEHLYISWAKYDTTILKNSLENIYNKNRRASLTIEPWPIFSNDVLTHIQFGKYDGVMKNICSSFPKQIDTIYISWGHEMDQDLTSRYTWSGQNCDAFVSAYCYVVDFFNQHSHAKIKWIWAPVVKDAFEKYWPGDDYVDIIGFPIYSFPEWDKSYHGYIRSFTKTFEEKYNKVKQYNKDVFIIEFGCTGSDDYRNYWLTSAFRKLEKYSLLHGIFFFHSEDTPGAWGEKMSTPDWRTNKELIEGLIEWQKNSNSNET